MTSTRRVSAFALLFFTCTAAASTLRPVKAFVTLEGKPFPGLHLELRGIEEGGTVRATTNARGVAVFHLHEATVLRLKNEPSPPYMFSIDAGDAHSNDFVIQTTRADRFGMKNVALRSAKWQMRTTPRICDELARVRDIPVGSLPTLSADDYNSWYSNLSPEEIANCKTLATLQADIGSLAPWYFYAYKGEEHQCVGGHAHEIDWATWYRSLLEEATGANPGECESDWERWWSSRGYGRLPDYPQSKVGARE